MILAMDGKAFVGRIGGGAFGDGPAQQHAIKLEAEIVMQQCRVVLLHDEAQPSDLRFVLLVLPEGSAVW